MSAPTIEADVKVETDHGDADDAYQHYVPYAELMEAQVLGGSVTALCGKTWHPSDLASKRPVCPACEEIINYYPSGEDETWRDQ